MITDALQAWVIHKYGSGDTSARVIFFTREYGLVNCLYKGGRTPKKQALTQAFVPLWLTLDIRSGFCYVRQLEMASAPFLLKGQCLFSGLYLNELLHHALRSQDPHEALYHAYIQTLKILETVNDRLVIESALRRFEWTLLTSCGYHMSLTHEAGSFTPLKNNQQYRFVVGEGFIVTDEQDIDGSHILAMAADDLNDSAVLKTAKRIMRRAINHALGGKDIKARALYRS